MTSDLRVGIIGAGYIAPWHADAIRATPGARLVAVCDPARDAAEALAHSHGIAAFADLDQMIAAGVCDVVHILTPPNLHRDLAIRCLNAGLHVLVEKPVALSVAELDEMAAAAQAAGRQLGACHNFLGLPAYGRLKSALQAGDLGLVSSAQINWALPLVPLRSGPYGLWMLRETPNLLLELGAHPFSLATDLFGPLEIEHVSLGQWVPLPGGEQRPQSWRILARAGRVDVSIALSLVETFDDRSVTLRGSSGLARLDYGADTLVIARDNTADLVLNPLLKELGRAGGHLREGLRNAVRQAASLNQKSPYGLSFRATVAAFHAGLREGRPDPRLAPPAARMVMQGIEDSLARLPELPAVPARPAGRPAPRVLVIGGTGFIGRNLTRRLVEQGHDVRVVSRGRQGPFPDLADRVDTVGVSMRDEDGLVAAMQGMDCVINLAKSTDKNWQAALENDVATTERIGRAAIRAGIGRLIHTGTIASYDMSDPGRSITEATDFGAMEQRNIYARAKAEGERRLLALQAQGLRLVIARPGIVLGDGGPLQHWGIGRWHGAGAVRLWGSGRNILPFVLADDVSDGIIAMMDSPRALGESFNLVGEPLFSGRDYFAAIHRRTGARLRVSGSNLTALWAADVLKQGLKRYALRRRDAAPASLSDWKSRGHLSPFDNRKPKELLGWRPEADPDAFWRRAIDQAHLFW
ncbi:MULTISPECIES: NAD-dependent epimerase/dehydratase family protein [unclassified Paracoccus (in: a-proteobacteria)]|uniref:NAD-dependent epimerase/dehydratase family protein n=1 Tax=unclassified Paracoccus (in: a-proteobacteria) TaxID=2688777 RepID=UPI0021E18AAD|nr:MULTISPECIES: NAD-dependent epimerase/dehydratase family protein [unclassified Paracoccus (in: a-proteobacteria)]UXU75635.1 Gfo/Idh/MocA family oxidoreductase [Paracoccus sp. SMMA_5]UXU81540.1 Gfo/Idh/MocA family oxidoreductase [Paracoccus sp. SMMA_5_TC]